MRVKALIGFGGAFSMYKGEVKECNNNVILQDLLKARYVEEVKEIIDIQSSKEQIKEVKEAQDGEEIQNSEEEIQEVKEPEKAKRGRIKKGENEA
jgi:plasmid rolling circle replication initiator protein Rep